MIDTQIKILKKKIIDEIIDITEAKFRRKIMDEIVYERGKND